VTAAPEVRSTAQFVLEPRGPFSFQAAARFWSGFTPAAHTGIDAEGHLHMAFPVEGSWTTAGVCLRDLDGTLTAETHGDVDAEAVGRQTTRMLSLDVDGDGFSEIGARDAVVGDLQRRYPGLRPVCFYSTYEAAVWAILSQRVQMTQAARIKDRMREALGHDVSIHGHTMRAFPPPAALLELTSFQGLFGSKVNSLHAIASASLAGDLEADQLRSQPAEEALRQLQTLPGIGPFGAELILLRGAGHPDYLTLHEPRFRRAAQIGYQLDQLPTDEELWSISDAWRPYRTWVTFLFRQHPW
jgi:DNA-3-methyladenine glycosylase II